MVGAEVVLIIKLFEHRISTRSSHALSKLGIIEQPHHCIGKGAAVLRLHQQPGFSIRNDLGDTADPGGNHRFPEKLGFYGHASQALGERWQHQGTASLNVCSKNRLLKIPREHDLLGKTEFLSQ